MSWKTYFETRWDDKYEIENMSIFIWTRMVRKRGDCVVVTEYPHSLNISVRSGTAVLASAHSASAMAI